MNEVARSSDLALAHSRGDLAAGAIAGLIAGLGVMTVVALAAVVALSKVTPATPKAKAHVQVIKKLQVEPTEGVQSKEEQKGGRVYPLFPDEKGIRE